MNTLIVLMIVLCAAAMVWALLASAKDATEIMTACNDAAPNVSPDGVVRRTAEGAAITTRHLLLQQGTAANEVAVRSTGKPMYVGLDEADEDAGLACAILGTAVGTRRMVCGEGVDPDPGDPLYADDSGMVDDDPANGDHWYVGDAVGPKGEDDEIEVAHVRPREVTIDD